MSAYSPMDSHRYDAILENARFLLDDAKMHPDRVAHRLGMTRAALDKMVVRHGEPDPDGVETPGGGQGEEPVPTVRRTG